MLHFSPNSAGVLKPSSPVNPERVRWQSQAERTSIPGSATQCGVHQGIQLEHPAKTLSARNGIFPRVRPGKIVRYRRISRGGGLYCGCFGETSRWLLSLTIKLRTYSQRRSVKRSLRREVSANPLWVLCHVPGKQKSKTGVLSSVHQS
jgi:hypothetical protein